PPSPHNPHWASIYVQARAKSRRILRCNKLFTSGLRNSVEKGERPVGGPAARGHGGGGGAETRGAFKLPESTAIMPRTRAAVDSPPGSFGSGTKVLSFDFAPISLV